MLTAQGSTSSGFRKPKLPSRGARALGYITSRVVRRESWGGERTLALLSRLLFGVRAPYGLLHLVGLRREKARGPVAGEWIIPRNVEPGSVLYVHGGGYVSCSPATHRPVTAALARLTRRRVFAVDYRRAPEHRFPAAADDVIAAYRMMIASQPADHPVAIAGDSAGGGLALVAAMHARDAGLTRPACVVVFSPWTDLEGTGESVRTNDGKCAMLRSANIPQFASVYLGGESPRNPKASPLFGAASNLPPVQFHVGSTELLLDDSTRLHQKILQTGGSSELLILGDVMHGIQLAVPFVPEARESVREAARFIASHLENPG